MKPKFLKYFMDVAELTAKLSYAKRMQVGAVIVKDDSRIISIGYNGTYPGDDNCCEDENGETKPDILHAEFNALMKLSKTNESANGATMFITHMPCLDCAKLILNSGIKKVYYKTMYRSTAGFNYLADHKLDIKQII